MTPRLFPRSGAVAAIVLAACGGGSAHPATLPTAHTAPPPTLTVLSTSPSSASTVVAAATSAVSTSAGATTVPAPTRVRLSAGGPWTLVSSAPGITTPGLVYQLMPKVWVYLPTEEDIPKGIIWTLHRVDIPIIEAYLQARLVYFKAASTRPIDLSSTDWTRWYSDGGAAIKSAMKPAIDGGWSVDLDGGVVLRPQVLGDGRDTTHAVVFDCVLDGSVYRLPTRALAPGSTSGVAPSGFGSKLAKTVETWKVTQVGEQREACA